VVLSPNHWQTVDLGIKAQPRNPRSSSPRARCRSYMALPNLPIIPGPLHQVSYSYHNPHRCPPYRTCHLHTTRQVNAILQTRIIDSRIEPRKCPWFEFKPRHVNDSSQSNKGSTLFLNLPLDESIDNKKHKVWISNPRHNEAQLEDQKPRKAQGHLEGKTARPTKRHEKRQIKEKSKKSSKSQKLKTSPNTLNASSLP
jgi:hypothetical protein